MLIATRHWGAQEIDEARIVTFPNGLPGFPDCRRFAVLSGEGSTFLWLQSVEQVEVALPMAEAFSLFPDYDVELDADDAVALQITDPERVAVFVIVTVHGDPLQAHANLVAPVIINTATCLGRQKILTQSGYAVNRPLFPQPGG